MEATATVPRIPMLSVEVMEEAVLRNKYIPKVPWPKQMTFLQLACQDALYGGAAGGGKSEALLMAALMFAEVPGYAALIVRRRFKDLELPGGLIDRSLEWLSPLARKGLCHWNGQEHRWRFKSGATLQFGYADREGDEKRYDGSEFQFSGLDEACHFTERQIVYFWERLRKKVEIPVPIRMRLGTTPGGPGHAFIHSRYIKHRAPEKAFIPATVDDNPAVDAAQYRASLEEIKRSNPLRYRQMLLGDWEAVEGGRFQMAWLQNTWAKDRLAPDWCTLHAPDPFPSGERKEVERFNWRQCATFQTYDPSASGAPTADPYVVSTWKVTPKGNVVWWGCHIDREEFTEQMRTVERVFREHQAQFIAIEKILNQTAHYDYLKRRIIARPVSPRSKSKLDRAQGFIVLASTGRLFFPEPHPYLTFPLDEVRGELVRFTGLVDDEQDHCVDCGSYAVELLPTIRPGAGSGGGPPGFVWTSKKSAWSGMK